MVGCMEGYGCLLGLEGSDYVYCFNIVDMAATDALSGQPNYSSNDRSARVIWSQRLFILFQNLWYLWWSNTSGPSFDLTSSSAETNLLALVRVSGASQTDFIA